jgi:hypothetical protein
MYRYDLPITRSLYKILCEELEIILQTFKGFISCKFMSVRKLCNAFIRCYILQNDW